MKTLFSFAVLAFAVTTSSLVAPATAAGPLAAIVPAAEKEGTVVWYESSPDNQADKIIAAFNKRYPSIKLVHVRSIGGLDIGARVLQETQAHAATADVATTGADQATKVHERGETIDVNWAALGVPKVVVPEPWAVITAASLYAIQYNTQAVSEKDAPRNWDDLLDAKWKGKLGVWVNAHPFAQVEKVWGATRTTQYVQRFAAQNPQLYRSTFPLAQAVAAGVVPVALGIWHAGLVPIRAGAPMKQLLLDPLPISPVFSWIPKAAPHPNAARLLIAWLATKEGEAAYAEATGRGNPYLDSETAHLIQGKTISVFPLSETAAFSQWLEKYNAVLKNGGKSAG
ncbi:MAG: ABC transporter substrate-binding protein [Vulcanimicrobiaceae bacterium]